MENKSRLKGMYFACHGYSQREVNRESRMQFHRDGVQTRIEA